MVSPPDIGLHVTDPSVKVLQICILKKSVEALDGIFSKDIVFFEYWIPRKFVGIFTRSLDSTDGVCAKYELD